LDLCRGSDNDPLEPIAPSGGALGSTYHMLRAKGVGIDWGQIARGVRDLHPSVFEAMQADDLREADATVYNSIATFLSVSQVRDDEEVALRVCEDRRLYAEGAVRVPELMQHLLGVVFSDELEDNEEVIFNDNIVLAAKIIVRMLESPHLTSPMVEAFALECSVVVENLPLRSAVLLEEGEDTVDPHRRPVFLHGGVLHVVRVTALHHWIASGQRRDEEEAEEADVVMGQLRAVVLHALISELRWRARPERAAWISQVVLGNLRGRR
jgi:hypothetical protein